MKAKIEKLVAEELARANEKFPAFSSNHEAYAVLLEEVEELQHEVERVDFYRDLLWFTTKGKNQNYTLEGGLRVFAEQVKVRAINTAEEAIQVAAMCDKWMQLLEKENDRG